MAETLDSTRLPCGCVISRVVADDGEKQLRIRPCSLTCEYYATSMKMAEALFKPIKIV